MRRRIVIAAAAALLVIACKSENKAPASLPAPTPAPSRAPKAPPPAPPADTPEPARAQAVDLGPEGEIFVGTWVCNASLAWELTDKGEFIAHGPAPIEGQRGTWRRRGMVLEVTDSSNIPVTILLENAFDSTLVVKMATALDDMPNWLCPTGTSDEMYAELEREFQPQGPVEKRLVGDWYGGDGFELKADGTYVYSGPDCENGTWKVEPGALALEGCGSPRRIDSLTSHRLVLDGETYYRKSNSTETARFSRDEMAD